MIKNIKQKFQYGEYEYSIHALNQSIVKHISDAEIREAMLNESEILEDYPKDKYGPSCLVYAITGDGRHLHILISYPTRPLIKIITVYEPDPELWNNYKIRKLP